MANIISVVSSKGGTGKTTVALNLAVALAENGENTLLVDVDPHGAVGLSLARNDAEWTGLAEYIIKAVSLEDAVIKTKLSTLSILPRGRLDPLDIGKYEQLLQSSAVLSEVIKSVGDTFRYIIIDTPSGLGTITRAALSASTFALLPLQAESLSLRSISQTLRVIAHIKESENPDLQLLGIVATMVLLHQDSFHIMNTVWSSLSGVLETYIPRTDVYALASEKDCSVAFLAVNIRPALRFKLLATEIKNIIQELGGTTETQMNDST
jgi:chromosome partitioning protein